MTNLKNYKTLSSFLKVIKNFLPPQMQILLGYLLHKLLFTWFSFLWRLWIKQEIEINWKKLLIVKQLPSTLRDKISNCFHKINMYSSLFRIEMFFRFSFTSKSVDFTALSVNWLDRGHAKEASKNLKERTNSLKKMFLHFVWKWQVCKPNERS